MQPPEKRNPAAGNGRVNRQGQLLSVLKSRRYDETKSVATLGVYSGRLFLGGIVELDGTHQAFDTDGAPIGVIASRKDAARAFSGRG